MRSMFDSELSMLVVLTLLRFPIFKLLPSISPKLYLLHFKTLALMSFQNKLLS
jgi:hypothetical protein